MSNKKLKPNKKKSFIDLFKFRINKKKSFMDLFNLFLEHKKLFIFGFATLLVYVIISCLAPVFVNMIVHNFTKLPDSYGNIVYTCIVIICLYLLSFSSFAVCNFIYSFIDVKVATTLRNKIINKFPRLPLKYFDKTKIGDTLNIAVNATNDITDNLSTSLVSLIQGAIFLVGILTAMFILSWQLAFACLIALPIGFVCMSIFMKMGEKYYKQRVATLGKVNANVEESFTGIQVTELYNLKKVKAISFAKDNKNLRNANKYSTFFGSVHMSIFAFVANLGYTIVCLTCALLALDAKDPEKWLTLYPTFVLFVSLLNQPLSNFGQGVGALQTCTAANDKIQTYLREEEMPIDPKDLRIKNIKGAVEFKNVNFSYNPEKTIIKNFSASIKPGMKVAIVGPTGAGKTTMVNLLMRFYEINKGSITIDGVDTKDMHQDYLRSIFGMVLQDPWTFTGTIKENIGYSANNINFKLIQKICKETDLDHVIRTLPQGYDTVIDEKTSLSIGEKQLLTIVRAMVHNAPLIILDEATSNIDTRTEILIQKSMDKLIHGRTSFVIAHRLSTIKNADLILVMKAGDIVEQGTHNQLLKKNGFYATLYNTQFNEEIT